MTRARRWLLRRRPDGVPQAEDFSLETFDPPSPRDGQIRVETLFVGVDPGMRARLSEAESYAPPIPLGGPVEGANLARVTESRAERFQPGDLVTSALGWQEAGVLDARAAQKVPPELISGLPVQTALGIFGIPGLTAYFGLLALGQPAEGETVVVSSAAGAVGSLVGQIAKLKGARAVGIAGGMEKCRWLTEEFGFDAAVDYKAGSLGEALAAATSDGIDVYFDNVGGPMLDTVLNRMNRGGRIVISGQVAEYNKPEGARHGISDTLPFITHRLRMEGLVVFDYAREFPTALAELSTWTRAGRLSIKEDLREGIEALPGAFADLFTGRTMGRCLVRIAG